jgi:DNA-binding MarR family transcriptional regulator
MSISDRERALEDVRKALQATHAAGRRLKSREAMGSNAVGSGQLYLMMLLAQHGELTGAQLAHEADLTRATVAHMLDSLEAQGLVERERSTVDRRLVHNRLTEKGRRVQGVRQDEVERLWMDIVGGMPLSDLQAGARVLREIRRYYDSLGAHDREVPDEPAAKAV